MKRFREIIFKIDGAFCHIANVCIALNMLVVVISVLGRVLFRSPLLGLVDIVGFAFGLSCVFAFCVTERGKGHIAMDLLLNVLPYKGKVANHAIVGVLNLFTLGIITYIFFQYIGKTFASKMVSWTIHLPYYPFVAAAAIGMALFFVTALVNFILAFDEMKQSEEAREKESGVAEA